ncbi:MAG: tetratricopeptide repeat protein [Chloroflexota bacterium]
MASTFVSGVFNSQNTPQAAMLAYREGGKAAGQQDYSRAIRYYTDALNFDGTDALFRARTYEYRGQCHWLLGDFDRAEADYRAALATSDDPVQLARTQVRLGELADFQGDYETAVSLYNQALAAGIKMNNLLVIGRARRGLGIIHRKQGNTERAVTELTQALAAFRQAGEAREQARVLTSLGRTRHARGEYQHALSNHNEAYTILESLNDRWRIVQVLNDIGECHQALYDIDKARQYHEKALGLADEYEAVLLKPEILRNLGVDLVELGEYNWGMAYLQEALEAARKISNREQEALALYNLARAQLRIGNMAEAAESVTQLQTAAELLDADRFRALGQFVLGELLYQQGRREEAVAALNAAALAAQTAVDRGVLWKLHATMSHVVDNEAIAAVHRMIAAEFIRQTVEPLQDARLKYGFVHAPPVMAVLQAADIDPDKL